MAEGSAADLAGAVLSYLGRAISAAEAETLRAELQRGMQLYPDYRDHYGDPFFRKERVRLLLKERRLAEAEALTRPEDALWHHTLFARALALQGRKEESLVHWAEVLRISPAHPEAKRAFGQGAEAEVSPKPKGLPSPETPISPQMSKAERDLFATCLRSAKVFLEFGAGGSTSFAAKSGVSTIYSVESDQKWLDMLAARPELGKVRFEQVYIDLGPVGGYGTPTDPARAPSWPAYYTKVWERLEGPPDLVLVDGRFRVACTLATLLHCPAKTPILIHDFWNRPQYHRVLAHLDCIDQAESLGLFRAKPDLDLRKLAADLIEHALDTR